jgi:hypothetical protein
MITITDNAQIETSMSKHQSQPLSEKTIVDSKPPGPDPDSPLTGQNEINASAIKNFIGNFKNAKDVTWFKSANGLIVAYFFNEKIRNWVFFNDNGDCEYVLRHYCEEKLPGDVRRLVESRYYDFSIHHVSEITRDDKIVYTIDLEGKIPWKTVRITGGEIEVIQEFYKK